MSEEADGEPKGQAVARPPRLRRGPFYDMKEARARFKDLIVVFFGVYAAFVLNRFESDRRDSNHRRQILEALEHEVGPSVQDIKTAVTQIQASTEDFDRRLAAGEMPHLGVSYGLSGYSASDDATLLQAGGLELLDAETLDAVRKVNELQRNLAESFHNNFELGIFLLGSREDEDFYDSATRQLRRQYKWYPAIMHSILKTAQELLAAEEKLLALIQARRAGR